MAAIVPPAPAVFSGALLGWVPRQPGERHSHPISRDEGFRRSLSSTSSALYLPVVIVSVIGAEHHAVVYRHGPVLAHQLPGPHQEGISSGARVASHGQLVVGALPLHGELLVSSLDTSAGPVGHLIQDLSWTDLGELTDPVVAQPVLS